IYEWHSKCFQQSISLFICFCCSHQRDVHPGDLVDLFDADFWKYDLLADSQGIVTSSVKPFIIDSPEVTYPWQGHRDQTVKEFIHPIASQSYLSADRHAFSQLLLSSSVLAYIHFNLSSTRLNHPWPGLPQTIQQLIHPPLSHLILLYPRYPSFLTFKI